MSTVFEPVFVPIDDWPGDEALRDSHHSVIFDPNLLNLPDTATPHLINLRLRVGGASTIERKLEQQYGVLVDKGDNSHFDPDYDRFKQGTKLQITVLRMIDAWTRELTLGNPNTPDIDRYFSYIMGWAIGRSATINEVCMADLDVVYGEENIGQAVDSLADMPSAPTPLPKQHPDDADVLILPTFETKIGLVMETQKKQAEPIFSRLQRIAFELSTTMGIIDELVYLGEA